MRSRNVIFRRCWLTISSHLTCPITTTQITISKIRTWTYLTWTTTRSCYIFILNFWRLYSPWLIDNIRTLRNMPLCNIRCILPTTIPTFNIVVIVGRHWRRQIRYLSPSGHNSLHLSHCLHSILKLLMLNFPFSLLLFSKTRFHFWNNFRFFLIFNFILMLIRLNRVSLTHPLMFIHPVRIKFPTTSPTRN
jgi:hypothetical protein